jgi:hypothetical protein
VKKTHKNHRSIKNFRQLYSTLLFNCGEQTRRGWGCDHGQSQFR